MFKKFFLIIIILLLVPLLFVNAEGLPSKLSGKILLQVESRGEAWYVNPQNLNRYYLGRPTDAFRVMRELGLGISEASFNSFKNQAPSRLSGRILLRGEANGEAYYVNPVDLKMHYLGRPADAFRAMRELGLGITNNNLEQINVDSNSSLPDEEDVDPIDTSQDVSQEAEEDISTSTEDVATTTADVATNTEEIVTLSEECVFYEEFWNNKSLIGSPDATGTTTIIDYNWGQDTPNGLTVFNNFSARWTANCDFAAGRYNFDVIFDEAVKVYIDGTLFIRDWEDNAKTTIFNRERNIEEGMHEIKVEYYDASSWANIKFSWERTGDATY